ncbi:MAG: hypothetical protein ABIQ57_17800 [Candidatus Kapaibacterium sp.]
MEFDDVDNEKDDSSEEQKIPNRKEKLPPPKRKIEITEPKRKKKRKPNQVGGKIDSEESRSEDSGVDEVDEFPIIEDKGEYDEDPYDKDQYDEDQYDEDQYDGGKHFHYNQSNGDYFGDDVFDFGFDEEKREITNQRQDFSSSLTFPDLNLLITYLIYI